MSSAGSVIGRAGASAQRPGSNPDMTKVAVLATLLFLSLLFKLVLLYDNYYNGFLLTDVSLTNADEYFYLEEGRSLTVLGEKYGLGSNWLYVYMNALVFAFTSDVNAAFLFLCFFNMALSFLSPLLLLPVIRDCFADRVLYERAALLFLAFTWLWPQGAFLSAHNLKDTSLQLLVSAYVLLFYSFMREIDGQGLSRVKLGAYVLSAAGLVFLIFSQRNYLAAILFAISFFPVLTRKPGVAFFGLAVVAATIAVFPDTFVGFVQSNFLFSADAAKDFADALYAQGTNVRINQDPIGIFTSALRFFLGPVPTTPLDVYQFLDIFQVTVVYLLAYSWIKGLRNVPPSFRGFTIWLFISIGIFYGIAELFSGPRQRFASFDHIYLVTATVGAAGMRMPDIVKSLGVAGLVYVVGKYIALATY